MNMHSSSSSDTLGYVHIKYSWGKYAVYSICLLALCLCEIISIHRYLQTVGYTISQMEYVFLLLSCGANMPYSSILFLLFLGDMSQMNRKRFIRSNQHQFLYSLAYCLGSALITALLIVVYTYFLSIPCSSKDVPWTEATLISSQLTTTLVHPYIIQTIAPLPATILAFNILCMFWFVATLFLYIMSQLKATHLGIMIYVIGIQWNSIWLGERIPAWFPVRCYTLDGILKTAAKGDEAYAIFQGMQYLTIGIITLGIISSIVTKYAQSRETIIQESCSVRP